jgi:Ca2+-binding RTX toxin-like protein
MASSAQTTPSEPRNYVAPNAGGTATGSAGADDIFASGPGQTLIGNGGDDIFHIGTNTDAKIVETDPGISTVETWATTYTLAAGVDNLTAAGDYAHTLAGNADANVIVAAGGNDTLVGGKLDWLIGGGGQDTFVIRNGDAADAIRDMQAGAAGDVVKLVGTGWTTFAEVKAHMTDLPAQGDSDPSLPPLKHSSQLVLPSGERLNFTDVSMNDFTAANFAFDNSGATPSPSPAPAPSPTPGGGVSQPTSLGLKVLLSEDAFNGDAQFTIDVDGNHLAGPTSVTTAHSTGAFQEFNYVFNTTAPDAPHTVAIHFVNDAWGGSPSADRNLYVGGIVFGNQAYAGQTAQNDADLGQPGYDPQSAEMFINGTVTFANVTHAPSPSPAPTGGAIVGTEGSDSLTGTAAPETIRALGGDDILAGLGGGDELDGGAGYDIAVYSASPAGIAIDLAAGTASGGDAQGDKLIGIEAVRGSGFDDTITGDAGPNLLEGGAGNDNLHGGAGDDILLGGTRSGGEVQASTVHWTFGELLPTDNSGFDYLDGGTGNDTLIGGPNATMFIHAGNGSDTILNYAGSTIDIDGYAIGDLATLKQHATAGYGNIDVDLGNGEALHFVFGPHPGERSVGELDAMKFTFTNVRSTPSPAGEGPTPTPTEPRAYVAADGSGIARGTAGADDIFASGDGQTLIGNGGDDIFHIGTHAGLTIQEANPGTSTVTTWLGSYTLNDGIDNLMGEGAYAHALTGNSANNVVTGNGGNDTVYGGADFADDILIGAAGADTFRFGSGGAGGDGHDTVQDFHRGEGDKIALDVSIVHQGHVDNFQQLQAAVGSGSIGMTTGADYIRLEFPTSPYDNNGTLTIHGITDLNAADWIFATH